jgi:cytochrome c biogenesis protein CcmG/thiol:disulfide interchange protein DsbE
MYKLLALLMLGFTVPCMAQSELPSVKIKALSGKDIAFDTLLARGDTATVVSFWATWCLPCITELEAINDDLPALKKLCLLR